MKIGYVFWGKQPNQRRELGCKAINAEFHQLKPSKFHPYGEILKSFVLAFKLLFKKYDYIVFDSMIAMETAFFLKKLFFSNTKIIMMLVEPCFADYVMKYKKRAYMYKKIAGTADGFIVPSEMIKKQINKLFPGKPTGFSPSFIYSDIKKFHNIKPNLKNKKMAFIGSYRPEKNLDALLNAHKKAGEKVKIPKLYVMGKLTENLPKMDEFNISILGEANSAKYLSKVTFLLHPVLFDCAPIVILESMASGVIPIVSKNCGNYGHVEKIDKRLILDNIDTDTISKKLIEIQKFSETELKDMSKRCKKASIIFSKKHGIKMFVDAFEKIKREIK